MRCNDKFIQHILTDWFYTGVSFILNFAFEAHTIYTFVYRLNMATLNLWAKWHSFQRRSCSPIRPRLIIHLICSSLLRSLRDSIPAILIAQPKTAWGDWERNSLLSTLHYSLMLCTPVILVSSSIWFVWTFIGIAIGIRVVWLYKT